VLFMSESVTLAQVVRLAVLARAVNRAEARVVFAASQFDPMVFDGLQCERVRVSGPPAETVLRAVDEGKPYHDVSSLEAAVAEDMRVFEEVEPDVVVGDLRPSLAVSARLAKVPYANLINAYWSPDATRDRVPMPDHPIVSLVGVARAERYFPVALPKVMAHFAKPYRELRRRHGLADIADLFAILTDGDHTLFPDVPSLVPLRRSSRGQHYLGAIPWQPHVALPPWWDELRPDRPIVYVTLGSSGKAGRLSMVLEALADLDLAVVVATAGRIEPSNVPANTRWARFLPGQLVASRAALVISNGGSSTGYQALSAGKPVVGIAANLDQYLAMDAIQRAGAGVLLRAGTLHPRDVRQAVQRALLDGTMRRRAAEVGRDLGGCDARARFSEWLRGVVGPIPDEPRANSALGDTHA
jgi:UDP:flavonoid glycosyltransferase YjiC (YdhE family)